MSTLLHIPVSNGWKIVHHSLLDEDPEYEEGVCVNLTQDLLQLERGTDVLDAGFYQDHYRVMFVRNGDWEHPLQERNCTHRREVVSLIENWMCVPEDTRYISQSRRFKLLLTAWLATAIATIPFTIYPIYFPAGLPRLFSQRAPHHEDWYVLIGWLVYIGLSVGAFISQRRLIFSIVYSVLCLLLGLNCVGCREMMSDLANI